MLLHSADGFDWTEVSTDFLPEDVTHIGSIATNETETLLITGRPRVETYGWPTGTAPRSASETAPTSAAIPFAPYDGSLEVGTAYRVILSTHCGLDYLGRFNDTYWYLTGTGVPLPSGGSDEPTIRHYDQESEVLYALFALVDPTTGDLNDPTTGELLARYEASPAEPAGCE